VFWSINMARRKIKAISAKNHFFVKNIVNCAIEVIQKNCIS
jgi:hypothetical protein